jgi:hypothetical protein
VIEFPSVTAFTGSEVVPTLQQPHILGHLEGLVKAIVLPVWTAESVRGGNVSRENFNEFNDLDCISIRKTQNVGFSCRPISISSVINHQASPLTVPAPANLLSCGFYGCKTGAVLQQWKLPVWIWKGYWYRRFGSVSPKKLASRSLGQQPEIFLTTMFSCSSGWAYWTNMG